MHKFYSSCALACLLLLSCTTISKSYRHVEEIPHTRDRFNNIWFNLGELEKTPSQIIPLVQQYLAAKKNLEGCFVRVPHTQARHIEYLKSQGFSPYRLGMDESVWIYRNGRGIPDQSNTLADARVVLFNLNGEMLLIRDRGARVWTLPGGGIEANELIRFGAVREVREEVGTIINDQDLQLVAVANLNFAISEQATNIVQHFYVHTKPVDSELTLERSEIDDYAWINTSLLTSDFKHKEYAVNKKILDLASQYHSHTSKSSSVYLPQSNMTIDTFRW